MTALRKDRVNHAYLFSGPRGCGKTTSRPHPRPLPELRRGPHRHTLRRRAPPASSWPAAAPARLDVIEIDAASHGGVDDARDLRERATYAPVRDRYKIFIIDEAHMVTPPGFNALLKIVEEPPRTHQVHLRHHGAGQGHRHHPVPHAPLPVPAGAAGAAEAVPGAALRSRERPGGPGVLSLVIRAGGGLRARLPLGAGPAHGGRRERGLDYELAVALLGYTHASLLDDVVEALAARDAATVFRAVDRVIQTGHDPRRFVEDLLERFRDLIIVEAPGEAAQAILRGMPADQLAPHANQATTSARPSCPAPRTSPTPR